ncbi:Putative cardiolipin synthase YbhO [Moraxella caviae]|uniref:Cardiolipin synthase YbhO n=2 Tax=Moraxella caviae TaxID=34060 RepID=A0A378R9D3_9GAMM|nr:Putative cardiolipin synthase YbhO [Moraxella caviae]VEW12894.1 Putative cardiolipin synthase YbhO [Moraxella caviae]
MARQICDFLNNSTKANALVVRPAVLPMCFSVKVFSIALSAFILAGCQSLPSNPHLPKSVALTQTAQQLNAQSLSNYNESTKNTQYAQNSISNLPPKQATNPQKTLSVSEQLNAAVDEQLATHHARQSGYYPISTGANAFAARSILSDMAAHTIDAQYYIWHNDEAGQLLMKDLWEAAERGVKVRLLLDDMNGSPALDEALVQFAKHPNIAVRLTNPFLYRTARAINFFTNPARINRRMHNKSMTFDNRLSIVGGRNIGNEYLNNTNDNAFADLDVLLIGAVVHDINASFEHYWNSPNSYDIETLTQPTQTDVLALLNEATLAEIQQGKQADASAKALRTYRTAVQNSTIGNDLLQNRVPFRWANITFVADPADKLQKHSNADAHLVEQLRHAFGTPTKNLSVISSYFVPTKDGVRTLVNLAKQGVDVRILTNSFGATDVGVVHSGYAHWRKPLLKAGVKLYELKPTAQNEAAQDKKFWRSPQSTTSLHAKAFAVDEHHVFIGSYNIDPRSANINTELGVVIDDHRLAQQLHQALASDNLLNVAYEVRLNDKNRLEWHTNHEGKPIVFNKEPDTTLKDRAGVSILGVLPLDWLL